MFCIIETRKDSGMHILLLSDPNFVKTKILFVFIFICFELDCDAIHDVKDTFILVMLLLVIIHHGCATDYTHAL